MPARRGAGAAFPPLVATGAAASLGCRSTGGFIDIGLFATAWGPRHGGINAFNHDLDAARVLDVSRTTVRERMKRLGLAGPDEG
jgi:hypothetical protein